MGLSNEKAQEEISTYQVLVGLAQALKNLTNDPKALEKAAKDAYALPAQEEAKANELRGVLDEHRKLSQEIKTGQSKLDSANKELSDARTKFEEDKKSLDEYSRKLNEKNKLLIEMEKANLAEKERLQKETEVLATNNSALSKDRNALKLEKSEHDKEVAAMREKAEQLKGLAAGL